MLTPVASKENSSTPWEPRIRALLTQRDPEVVDIKSIADSLKTSPRSLQRHLAIEGIRFIDIVGTYRAEKAARLLAYSKESLAQIGFATGYSDQAHFSREFSRKVGLRPQQYRNQALQTKFCG